MFAIEKASSSKETFLLTSQLANINSLHMFQLKKSCKCFGKKYTTLKNNIMPDSENPFEYCCERENEDIGSSSESELESGYLNESFPAMKLEPCQYKSLKKNPSSENNLAEEEKGNEIVASQSEDHKVGHIGWCSRGNCREESRGVDCLCCREVDAISGEQILSK